MTTQEYSWLAEHATSMLTSLNKYGVHHDSAITFDLSSHLMGIFGKYWRTGW